jgi:hypothetical protein
MQEATFFGVNNRNNAFPLAADSRWITVVLNHADV